MSSEPITIGRAEEIQLPKLLGAATVTAKVDTGADVSSLWASDVKETAEGLQFAVFGPGFPLYSGDLVTVPKSGYRMTRVANSFGEREERFVIKTPIRLGGRRVLASFTLADRSKKTYPILLGRRLLTGKFLVDVSAGKPLNAAEKAKRRALKRDMNDKNDKLGA